VKKSEIYEYLQFDLRTKSAEYCLDIFNDFSEDEIKKLPASIQRAWNVGKEISNQMPIDKLLFGGF